LFETTEPSERRGSLTSICLFRYIPSTIEGQSGRLRPLEWIGGPKKDLIALPEDVVNVFGYALYLAQELEDEQK